MLGSPALAALTLGVLGGYRAIAVACAATTIAYSVDLIAGSPLTQLSLVGPNPAAGHRYYGIGNELEACLSVLVLVGTGAALFRCAFPAYGAGKAHRKRVAPLGAWTGGFLVVAVVFSFVFAYGRYGADVGAAIALPLGAAVAAALLADRRDSPCWHLRCRYRRWRSSPPLDLLSGANAHLTSTVLHADSGGDVLAVLRPAPARGRRELRPPDPPRRPAPGHCRCRDCRGSAATASKPGCGLSRRCAQRCWAPSQRPWWARSPTTPAPCLLEIGTVYLLAFCAYAWAESERSDTAQGIA